MRFKHLLTLVTVAGCSELPPENAPEESQQVLQEQPGETLDVPTDDAGDKSEVTYALAKQDLPPCTPARENRLFYTKAEDAFFVCSGESKSWEQVNLKGADGKAGPTGEPAAPCQVSESGLVICGTSSYQIPPPEQGPQVQMGPQGENGAKGDQGLRGERGEAGAAGPTGSTGAQGGVGPAGPIGPQGPAGTSGKNSLIKTVTEAAGPNCAAGGQKILVGIDDDGDGVLQAGEEDSASFLCNGETGATGPQGIAGVTGPRGESGSAVGMNIVQASGSLLGRVVEQLSYFKGTSNSGDEYVSEWYVVEHGGYHTVYSSSPFALSYTYSRNGSTTTYALSSRQSANGLTRIAIPTGYFGFEQASCTGSEYVLQTMTGYIGTTNSQYSSTGFPLSYFAGYNIALSASASEDIVPDLSNYSATVSIRSVKGTGGSTCAAYCNSSGSVGCSPSYPGTGRGYPFATIGKVFPDSVPSGWRLEVVE